jgi:hypothetical protein
MCKSIQLDKSWVLCSHFRHLGEVSNHESVDSRRNLHCPYGVLVAPPVALYLISLSTVHMTGQTYAEVVEETVVLLEELVVALVLEDVVTGFVVDVVRVVLILLLVVLDFVLDVDVADLLVAVVPVGRVPEASP